MTVGVRGRLLRGRNSSLLPAAAMENQMEMPECPVCLQVYDEEEVIPRVLPCGHSACSPCIALLSSSSLVRSFADAIRCPACNQVVPYPKTQGPSALPKNIDLLRICSSSSSTRNHVDSRRTEPKRVEFLPLPWNDPFWASWKGWIIPDDAISVSEPFVSGTESVSAILRRAYISDRNLSFRENTIVRLLAVSDYCSSSLSPSEQDGSVEFKLSYPARIMEALSKLTEKERHELHLILLAPSIQRHGLCRILGLWMSIENNSPLFLVSEAFQSDLSVSLDDNQEIGLINADDMFGFTKMSLDLCEAIVGLHSQGVTCGFLTVSCFRFDSYGHFSLDLSEVLLACKRAKMDVAEAMNASNRCFVSPEVHTELLMDKPHPSPSNGGGYGSDVWSLACILIFLLVGDGNHHTLWDSSTELSNDVYDIWMKKLISTLRSSLQGTRFDILMPILESCLNYDPESRPQINELWRSLMSLSIRSKYVVPNGPETLAAENLLCCLVFADLCRIPAEERKILEEAKMNQDGLSGFSLSFSSENDDIPVGKTFHGRELQSVSLKGHQDCVTGLANGDGFLFSCSFDKTVHVWSLEDFSHVRTLRGPEQKLMAVVTVNLVGKPALCIAGDGGGGLSAWDVSMSATEELPLKMWRHHSDWRYSGVHSLATSQHFLYSGGGDRTIKAWSLQDFSLVCTLEGHKSAVSCLAASEGILYSGSWDGTIRLWWLHDHTPLAELKQQIRETLVPNGASVLSLSASGSLLASSYDTGSVKVWREGVLVKSAKVLDGAIFSVVLDGRWVFAGGWDSTVLVQELLSETESGDIELRPMGSFALDSVVTSLLHYRGMLFVGSNRDIKVHYLAGERPADEFSQNDDSSASISTN